MKNITGDYMVKLPGDLSGFKWPQRPAHSYRAARRNAARERRRDGHAPSDAARLFHRSANAQIRQTRKRMAALEHDLAMSRKSEFTEQ